MKNSNNKTALNRKWKQIEIDFRKKYNILNSRINQYEDDFDQLLSRLQTVTGLKKRELRREIRTWDTDISDMYSF